MNETRKQASPRWLDHGVAIFTMPKAGLMYEAAVAGQKFSYTELPASAAF